MNDERQDPAEPNKVDTAVETEKQPEPGIQTGSEYPQTEATQVEVPNPVDGSPQAAGETNADGPVDSSSDES